MERATGIRLAVALLAVVSLGVSATTIESTLATDPSDVVDLDDDRIPIGQDDLQSLREEVRGSTGAETAETAADSDEQSEPLPEGSADGDEDAASSRDESDAPAGHRLGERSVGSAPDEPSLLDRLLPLLLFLAALVATAWLAIRYRHWLLVTLGQADGPVVDGRETEAEGWQSRPPENVVEDAWAAMFRRVDPGSPASMTPRQRAAEAVERGFDRETVRALTEAFEEVRYGGKPVTERRERAARRASALERGRDR